MGKQCLAEVNNLPDEIEKYIVARVCDGEMWFWGTYGSENRAKKAANDIDGVILERMD